MRSILVVQEEMVEALLPSICGNLDPILTVHCVIILGRKNAIIEFNKIKKYYASEAREVVSIAKEIIGEVLAANVKEEEKE